jgi:hypothetical protein
MSAAKPAQKEATKRRATDAQVLEDTERLIAAWNEHQAKWMPMLFSLNVGTANLKLPLQEKSKQADHTARPKQRSVVGGRAEKARHIGNHSARARESVQALDRRATDHLSIEAVPPSD